jgi:sec-independent protein translocase protein TatB
MFDVGFLEFAVIGLIALLVIGPEKMPAVARKVGAMIGKFKRIANEFKDDIDASEDFNKLKEEIGFEEQKEEIKKLSRDVESLKDFK